MRDLKVNDERAAEIGRRVGGYRNHGHMTALKLDVADLLSDRQRLLEYWRDHEMLKSQLRQTAVE